MAKKRTTSNLPVAYDEELARMAQAGRQAEAASATGNFISVRGGIMQWRGAPITGNVLDCVIISSVYENNLYEEGFDPDNPSSPSCYAFGVTPDALAPHPESENKQGDQNGLCAACWANGFGSDPKGGKGKACQNRRRIALIAGNQWDGDAVKSAEVGFLRLPVMSTAGYSNHVMQVADVLKRPVFGVLTEISVVPDAKTQFRIMFKIKEPITDHDTMAALLEKAKAVAAQSIVFPYPKNAGMPKWNAGGKRKVPVKQAGRKQPQQQKRKF